MGWYKDAPGGNLYWLIESPAEINTNHSALTAPTGSIHDHEYRPILEGDVLMASSNLYFTGSVTVEYRSYMTKKLALLIGEKFAVPNPPVVTPTKTVKFPSRPTYSSLLSLIGNQKAVALDSKVALNVMPGNVRRLNLIVNGLTPLYWEKEPTHERVGLVYSNLFPVDLQLNAYNKYLGQDFEIDDKRCQVRYQNQEWYKISDLLIFNLLDGHLVNRDLYNKNLKYFNKIETVLNSYYDMITPEFLLDLYKDIQPGYLIGSRCPGCKALDTNHLIVHVYHKELPFFMVLATYDLFSKDGLTLTWDLFDSLRKREKEKFYLFKKYLKAFLDTSLLPKHIMYPKPMAFTVPSRWHQVTWPPSKKTFESYPSHAIGEAIFQTSSTISIPHVQAEVVEPPLDSPVVPAGWGTVENDFWPYTAVTFTPNYTEEAELNTALNYPLVEPLPMYVFDEAGESHIVGIEIDDAEEPGE